MNIAEKIPRGFLQQKLEKKSGKEISDADILSTGVMKAKYLEDIFKQKDPCHLLFGKISCPFPSFLRQS